MLRVWLVWTIVTACTDDIGPPAEPPVDLLDRVWAESIRAGDVIVVVPGTGSFTGLGKLIEEEQGVFDGREHRNNVDPVEGAVASAQRAGFTAEQLEAGAITFAMWGAGITQLERFEYISMDGLRIQFEVIGGHSACGDGGIADNLRNYNAGNAQKDARDLFERTQAWLAAHPGAADRNVNFASHSWGGVVAEYFATNLATLVRDHGELGANPAFVVAAGVPGFVPNFRTHGPGFRTVDSTAGDITASIKTYEVDRPDDPIRTFDPNANGGGHHYIIVFGTEYMGWYGVTTDELSCGEVPGICPPRS